MKKILFIFVVFIFNISVSKALEPRIEYLKDIYSNRKGDKLYSGQMGIVYLDNKLVYCIDPYLTIGEDYTIDNSHLYEISESDLEFFEVVAYYGYNETNRNNFYYYMAAQELIWERIIGNGKISWTSRKNNSGNGYSAEIYKREIMNNVKNYYTKPTIDNEIFVNDHFNIMDVYDNNYVINDFELINNGKSKIDIVGNKLTITVLDTKLNEVKLKRDYSSPNISTVYKSNGSQTLIGLGLNRTVESKFFIKTGQKYYSFVGIKFYDKETGILINDCNDYDIYDTSNGYKYPKLFSFENDVCKYIVSFEEGIYSIGNSSDEYIIDDSIKFEINEDIYMGRYTEFEFYIEKKKEVEKEIIEESSNEIDEEILEESDNEIDKEILEEPTNDNYENSEKEMINEIIENQKIDNIGFNKELNKIEKEETDNLKNNESILDDNFTNESNNQQMIDNLPNTYDYFFILKTILAFACLMGCVFYKI